MSARQRVFEQMLRDKILNNKFRTGNKRQRKTLLFIHYLCCCRSQLQSKINFLANPLPLVGGTWPSKLVYNVHVSNRKQRHIRWAAQHPEWALTETKTKTLSECEKRVSLNSWIKWREKKRQREKKSCAKHTFCWQLVDMRKLQVNGHQVTFKSQMFLIFTPLRLLAFGTSENHVAYHTMCSQTEPNEIRINCEVCEIHSNFFSCFFCISTRLVTVFFFLLLFVCLCVWKFIRQNGVSYTRFVYVRTTSGKWTSFPTEVHTWIRVVCLQ